MALSGAATVSNALAKAVPGGKMRNCRWWVKSEWMPVGSAVEKALFGDGPPPGAVSLDEAWEMTKKREPARRRGLGRVIDLGSILNGRGVCWVRGMMTCGAPRFGAPLFLGKRLTMPGASVCVWWP